MCEDIKKQVQEIIMADIRKKFMELKVVELRQELEKLGLDKNGVKLMLVDRLVAVN